MAESTTRDWDAATYKRVALPHEEWARAVLDRLGLEGGETVLDAGCGSGRTTAIVIERLPEGRVIAVDGSPSMVEEVRSVLRPQDTALVSDLTKLELDERVDAVFSTAVFHWIMDHDALFARMRAALKDGGRFAAQCGGEGNIHSFRVAAEDVARREPYATHLRRVPGSSGTTPGRRRPKSACAPRASPTSNAGSSPGRSTRRSRPRSRRRSASAPTSPSCPTISATGSSPTSSPPRGTRCGSTTCASTSKPRRPE